jgi:hypothetical protein
MTASDGPIRVDIGERVPSTLARQVMNGLV